MIPWTSRPTVSETWLPTISRARVSRPRMSVPNGWPLTPGGVSMLSTCCVRGLARSPKWTRSGDSTATAIRNKTTAAPSTARRLRRNLIQASCHSPICSSGTSQSIGAASTTATGRATLGEPHPRVDKHVEDVDDQVGDRNHDREQHGCAEDHGIVARSHGNDECASDARDAEYGFDDDGTRDQERERRSQCRHDRNQ